MTAIWSDEAGPPGAPFVALVHGSMDRSSGMLRLSRQLDDHHRVLRYDRRGYGRSSPHPGPFSMADQVADLVHLLAGRAAVLIGHSYGGNVALATAAQHPDLVLGVAVYESPLSWEPWWPGNTAGAVATAGAADPAGAAEGFMRRMIGDARWDALPERTRATRRTEGVAMVAELADLRAHRPWHADQLHLPVVASYGEHGSAHQQSGMRHVADTVPDAQLVILPDCRHDAPLSHPQLFAERIVAPLVARSARHP